MGKYDRIQHRKEQRKEKADAGRREKKQTPHRKTYRRDKEGNIILWGYLKVTWVAILMFAGIIFVAAFLGIAMIMNDEEFKDENCRNPFCQLFIGEQIDPNDNIPFVPNYEEEESFEEYMDDIREMEKNIPLPPDDLNYTPAPEEEVLWTLIPEAEARGEDEPVCYSPACKKKYAEEAEQGGSGTSEYEVKMNQIENLMDDINERTKIVIAKIKEKEAEVDKQKRLVPELKEKWLDQRKNTQGNDGEIKGLEYKLKKMKKEYRDAYDTAETSEEITEAKRLKSEYNAFLIEFENALEESQKEIDSVGTYESDYEEAREALEVMVEELRELRDEFQDLRIEMFKAKTSDQFINIRLSGTCLVLIENGYPNNCPTYIELKEAFDNTDPNFSGGFSPSESGNDIRRDASQMQNYWNYYQQLPNWKIITVDPDAYMMTKGMLIEITAHHLKLKPDLETGIDFDKNEIYVQHGISINKTCSHATVSPDMELISLVVKQFFDRCNNPEDDWKKIEVRPIYDVLTLDKGYNPLWLNKVLHGE